MASSHDILRGSSCDAFLAAAQGRTCVLFGAGKCARLAWAELGGSIPFSYVVDNDMWQWGKHFAPANLPIRPPAKLLEEDPEKLVVLIALKDFFAVAQDLYDMGLHRYFAYPLFFEFLGERYTEVGISTLSL